MTARAAKRGGPSGLTAETLIEFVADRGVFEAVLNKFVKRRTEAENAELKARQRLYELKAREAELEERAKLLKAAEAKLAQERIDFDDWVAKYDQWMAARAA